MRPGPRAPQRRGGRRWGCAWRNRRCARSREASGGDEVHAVRDSASRWSAPAASSCTPPRPGRSCWPAPRPPRPTRLPRAQLRALRGGGARAGCARPATPAMTGRGASSRRASTGSGRRRWCACATRPTCGRSCGGRSRFDVPLVARAGGNAYNGGSTSRSAVVVDSGGLDRSARTGGGDRRPRAPQLRPVRGARAPGRRDRGPDRARTWRSAGSRSAAGWASPGAPRA